MELEIVDIPSCARMLVFQGDDRDRCETPFRRAFQLHMFRRHLPLKSDGKKLWTRYSSTHIDDDKDYDARGGRVLCEGCVYHAADNVVVDDTAPPMRVRYYLDEDDRDYWRNAPQVLAALRCPAAVESACAEGTFVVHVPPGTSWFVSDNGEGGEKVHMGLDKDAVLEDVVRGRPYRGVWTELVGAIGVAKVEGLIRHKAKLADAEFAAIKECPHVECFCKAVTSFCFEREPTDGAGDNA